MNNCNQVYPHRHDFVKIKVDKPTEGYRLKRFEKIMELFQKANDSTRATSPSSESICNARNKALNDIQKEIKGILPAVDGGSDA